MAREVNLFVATPAYTGSFTSGFHDSMLQTWVLCQEAGVTISTTHISQDGYIGRARAELLSLFLEHPEHCTHILWIDSDIAWEPQDVLRMVCADRDIVCAVYRKRTDRILGFPVVLLEEEVPDPIPLDKDGCFEIKYAPGGFCLIKRELILRMIQAYPERRCLIRDGGWFNGSNAHCYDFFPHIVDDDGVMLSEDYGFCKLARAIGTKIWCMPDIRLRHSGTKSFDGCLMDALRFKKEDPVVEAGAEALGYRVGEEKEVSL